MRIRTTTHSIGSISWIDPRAGGLLSLAADQNYGWTITDTVIQSKRYRFANFLEAFIQVDDSRRIINSGFTSESIQYLGNSFGIDARAFADRRKEKFIRQTINRKTGKQNPDGRTFSQLVGSQTVAPEKVGESVGGGFGGSWGLFMLAPVLGPVGVVAGYYAGKKIGKEVSEEIIVYPPIWTELELTIYTDGSFDGRLVRHSLFPSITFYAQINDTNLYEQQQSAYDGVPALATWIERGWGFLTSPGHDGPLWGNPWGIPTPASSLSSTGFKIPKRQIY